VRNNLFIVKKTGNILHSLIEKIFKTNFSHQGFLHHLKNTQWITIFRLSTTLFSLITMMVIARILGPTAFGALSYAMSFVGIFGIIASLGIDNLTFKDLTANKHRREEILGSSLLLKGATGLLATALVVICVIFSSEDIYIKKLIILASLSFITQPLLLLSYDFLKDSEGKYVAITQIATSLISNIFKILFIFFQHSITGFLIVSASESLIAGFFYFIQLHNIKKRTIKFSVSRQQILYILKLSLPLTFYSAFSELYSRIDQIMLRHYLDVASVGFYSVAIRLTEIWYMIPNILMGSLFPAFINSLSNEQEYRKRFVAICKLFTGIAVALSAIISLSSSFFVHIIYGNKFMEASPILSVYGLSLFGSFMSFIIYQDLFIRNKFYSLTAIPIVTAILNIFLNMLFIPYYGKIGPAIGTTISYTCIPVLYILINRYSKKTHHA
jgi:O-antigen/teichoic acid export membrane protein